MLRYFPKEDETMENKAEEDGEDMYHNLEDLVGQCMRFDLLLSAFDPQSRGVAGAGARGEHRPRGR
jgi:hypothetical protein